MIHDDPLQENMHATQHSLQLADSVSKGCFRKYSPLMNKIERSPWLNKFPYS
jgi:hypothetical protein